MEDNKRQLINTFYQHMGTGKFIRILQSYADGKGYGTEYARFVFADFYEKWEDDYFGEEGIAYYIDSPLVKEDEEIILDYPTFFQYLRDDCETYLKANPQDETEVRTVLETIKQRFNIIEP
ncbi:ribonuclease toxin immunity protein CdiI [Cytobacillus purgationiresistens]|uniref:CDI immunity protein domain-containing protein n=1 Tax=Cytobacillus purgationiresistens TaxID=863449 RepID=A0ABU0AKV4_9BACI|nr:ribonuclease toxin immunity protein CdiI [Cytobacillus purgationiresistens]MDQ0271898.1 hypothetical protein [Cytobacillus purgationiresistens]